MERVTPDMPAREWYEIENRGGQLKVHALKDYACLYASFR